MTPTIVVSAYNRPQALARLLASLAHACYPSAMRVRLIISIDRGLNGIDSNVRRIAEGFDWTNGDKEIIEQPERLGLVKHVLYCGGLSQEIGDIVFLEDDLSVSPAFYEYATQALDFYRDDDRVAGHCLYALWFNGYTQYPFVPIADGGDTFFLNVPYTQGQAFTAAQWARIDAWLKTEDNGDASNLLHTQFARFDAADWFPAFARYGAATQRYTVYPCVSLTTGAGDAGVHFGQQSAFFETPIQWRSHRYDFHPLDNALAVYDSFFEIRPDRLNRLTDALRSFSYDVDLNATKEPHHLNAEFVLTTRTCRQAVHRFGLRRWPLEANVVEDVEGVGISFCRREELRWDGWARVETGSRLHNYFTRRRRVSRRRRVLYWLLGLRDRLTRR